jgi:chromate transporter
MLLWRIFLLFTRVSFLTWGGGQASLGLMQRETTASGWITPAEFADAVALGNALPGPIASQVAAFVGYKLAGIPGAVAAAVGTIVPTTALMLVMVVFFFRVKDAPPIQAMLKAVRPVVIGLLLWTAYDLARIIFGAHQWGWAKALLQGWDKVLIAVVAFAALTLTTISPLWMILGAAVLGLLLYR